MGTRSLTYVFDQNNEPIVCMYRQFDGYPSGHGVELAKFLNSGEMVNGLPLKSEKLLFNGMGCLAAQIISHFKDEPGGFYLHAPVLNRDDWQDYEYHVYGSEVIVKNPTEVIFSGSWQEFTDFCEEEIAAYTAGYNETVERKVW